MREGFTGHLMIDDFHRLDDQRKARIANKMKFICDSRQKAKVTLVGINPVGESLTQWLPDLAGRFEVIRLSKQPDHKIAEMITKGELAANICFVRRAEFINAAMGSFFTAQRLCAQASKAAGVLVSQPTLKQISLGPLDVLQDLLDNTLRSKYHAGLLEVACCDESHPPRGATLALLWLLAQKLELREDGHISLEEARSRYPQLAPAFDWLRKSNLMACFEKNPSLRSLFFYNRGAGMLSIEDPQLEFYLRNLPFSKLAKDSGHVGVRIDHEHDLIVPAPGDVAVEVGAPTRFCLHLSDLHFGTPPEARLWYDQLAADLREQDCERLDALILSGDIANLSMPNEYAAAREFLHLLMAEFKLSAQQVVLVPGNHDVNWKLAEAAYTPQRRARLQALPPEGTFIDAGTYVEVRDGGAYKERFRHFADFYQALTGEPYPMDYEQQGTLHHLPQHGLLFLGLNSAWHLDHHFRDRAGIHAGALSQALTRIRQSHSYDGCLKIAVWHHSLASPGQDRITDASFLQALAKAEFRLALHGHIHKTDNSRYHHDVTEDGRRIDIVCAGTFGAPIGQWLPGYPLQYNLLKCFEDKIVVETRCREEPNGAWRPDARWQRGAGKDPAPRYELKLDAPPPG